MTFKVPNDNKLVDEQGRFLPQYRGAFDVIETLSKLKKDQLDTLLKFVGGFGSAEAGAIPVSEGVNWGSIPIGPIGALLSVGENSRPAWLVNETGEKPVLGGLTLIETVDMTGSLTKSINAVTPDHDNHLIIFDRCGSASGVEFYLKINTAGTNPNLARTSIDVSSGSGIGGGGGNVIETQVGGNFAGGTINGAMLILNARSPIRYKTIVSARVSSVVSPGHFRFICATAETVLPIDSYDFRLDVAAWSSGTATLYGF